MNTTPLIKRTKDGVFMVADLLEKGGYAPKKHHQEPFWNPTDIPAPLRSIHKACRIPALGWNRWSEEEIPEGTALRNIDANAAYLSAASSADFAHCALERLGAMSSESAIRPGYYLVDAHPWQLGCPGSPLGMQHLRESRVWVAQPTYLLLRDLTYGANWGAPGGHWPDCTIYDSWTADQCRFTDWTNVIRDVRKTFIEYGERPAYEALKTGYSEAVQMWYTPHDPKGTPPAERKKKNKAYRPDWYRTVHAQHAAKMWRCAYLASLANRPPVAVGGTGIAKDGMTFVEDDLRAVLALPKAPIRLDETGAQLGTFSRGDRWYAGIEDV